MIYIMSDHYNKREKKKDALRSKCIHNLIINSIKVTTIKIQHYKS